MANKAKAVGSAWETAIVNYLREKGWPRVERRALAGKNDKGDIAGIGNVVIEAKSQARFTLAEWLDEANKERDNAEVGIGVVWFKRKGKTSPGAGYVLMDGDTFTFMLDIIEEK